MSVARGSVRVAVGTCGFSYKDWVGPFYAPGTKSAEMLAAYARRFSVVEIDSSYYGVPSRATVATWLRRSPDGFRFTAKLPSTATHLPKELQGTMHPDVVAYRDAFGELARAGKFACAVAQFPNSFRPADDAATHLRRLRETLGDMPLVAEFRHRDWQTNDTLVLLRELGIGLVVVDQPQFASLLRPTADVTSPMAYVRMHGRNYGTWWTGDNETRYDYCYSDEELGPWADRLVDLAASPEVREVFGFFNNHRRAQAVRNAEAFEAMLAERFGPGILDRREPDTAAQTELPLE